MPRILTERTNNKIQTLIKAVQQNDVEKVMRVTNNGLFTDILNGIPINESGVQQFAALHVAIQNNNISMVEKLLTLGASANVGSDSNIYYTHLDATFGVTPLYIAIYTENVEAVRLLLSAGADANHYIVRYPMEEIEDQYEIHPLSFALSLASYNPDEMFRIIDHILSSGQRLDDIYKTLSYSTLINCIDRGLYSIVSLLLEKYVHANPNEIEIVHEENRSVFEKRNALMAAIDFSPESDDTIKELLRHGADPNNNIGCEYTVKEALHPELVSVNNQRRQSQNFQQAKDILLPEVEKIINEYNRDDNYKSTTLVTALDYAFKSSASPGILSALILKGGLLTERILHLEGVIVASGVATYFNSVNDDHIKKIRNIPNITPEEYEQCLVSMGSKDTLVDFITAEEVPIQNTVILPSVNENNKTCMDRNSFGKYYVSRMDNYQDVIHPFTRENMMQTPNYKEWKYTNYPFGMTIDYNRFRSPDNETRKGGKRRKKHNKTRSMRGKGLILSKTHSYEELRKDAKVVTQNLDELNKSNVIFDQYHRKKMEQLLEKDQKRMSKYSSLVVPLVDFLMDIKTLQDTGEHKEIPKDIMDIHQNS